MQITARGDDTSNLTKEGVAVFAEYADSETELAGFNYAVGTVKKNRDNTLYVEKAYTAENQASCLFWDSFENINYLMNKVDF